LLGISIIMRPELTLFARFSSNNILPFVWLIVDNSRLAGDQVIPKWECRPD